MKQYSSAMCLGYPIFNGKLNDIEVKNGTVVNTINQYSYCIAEQDHDFRTALNQSDILLPDGIGITFASKFLNNNKIDKIAGSDIHEFLLKKMNKQHGSCFYLGASNKTLAKIHQKISEEYPNITVNSYSPPYSPVFNASDNQAMVAAVNRIKPNVLFVGMTAPKQEKWAYANKEKLEVGLICSIGAVFDFYSDTINRPSNIWIYLGLEWLGRFIREPRRMWKRYVYYGAIYIGILVKRKIRGNKLADNY